jgi:hypothetical protein
MNQEALDDPEILGCDPKLASPEGEYGGELEEQKGLKSSS